MVDFQTPVLVTPAAALPVSLAEAKAHCREDSTHEDQLLQGLIEAATAHLNGPRGLGRSLINQVWRVSLSEWPTDRYIRIPFPDVSAATVKYRDGDNVEQTVASGSVSIVSNHMGSSVRISSGFSFPSIYPDRDDAIQITFTAGFGDDAASVPAPIKQAILLLVGHWFKSREAVAEIAYAELPIGVRALISPYKVMVL
jgi:uncharacterized phiE125 gp8 family phage protein